MYQELTPFDIGISPNFVSDSSSVALSDLGLWTRQVPNALDVLVVSSSLSSSDVRAWLGL
jgi:hypothetical protein